MVDDDDGRDMSRSVAPDQVRKGRRMRRRKTRVGRQEEKEKKGGRLDSLRRKCWRGRSQSVRFVFHLKSEAAPACLQARLLPSCGQKCSWPLHKHCFLAPFPFLFVFSSLLRENSNPKEIKMFIKTRITLRMVPYRNIP